VMRKAKGGPLRMVVFGIKMVAKARPDLFWPLVGGLIFAVWQGYIRWWTLPLLLLVAIPTLVVALVLRRYPLVKRDLSTAASVKTLKEYQDATLLDSAWSKPVASLYRPIVPQPVEGYCGQATVLNVVRSIPTHSCVPRLPPQARPITLPEMKAVCDQLASFDPKLKISKVESIDRMTLAQFHSHLEQLNNPRVRYLCNFLRSPMFFNDPNPIHRANILKRIFGGHWSPLGAYLDDKLLVQVLDVNESYGAYLVPVHRLYDAVNTHDLSNGKPRGLIRIELEE